MRWKPTRAGIFNMWEYDDQIFEFGDGRLALRGRNGSGKSNALSLLFPFILDGVMSAARMDAMGGGRSMKSLLLGRNDDEGAGGYRHDSGTGYVWMEFSDGTNHLTLGIGATATQHRDAEPWFFITAQRVGHDLELADDDTPLSRRQLDERLTDGAMFTTADEYRGAVDRRLFGLGPIRYRRLVDLLLTLRRPHLAGKLDTEHLSATLSAGLGELDPILIEDVAHSFDDLDAMQHELDGLATSLAAVERFLPVYRDHLIGVGRERARAVVDGHTELRKVERDHTLTSAERDTAHDTRADLAGRVDTALAERNRLDTEIETIQQSPAYQSATALDEVGKSAERAKEAAIEATVRADSSEAEAEKAANAAAEAGTAADGATVTLHESIDEWNDCGRAAGVGTTFTVADFDDQRAIAAVAERREHLTDVTRLATTASRARDEAERAEQRATHERVRAEAAVDDLAAAEHETERQRTQLSSLRSDWATAVESMAEEFRLLHPQVEVPATTDLWGPILEADGTTADEAADADVRAFHYADGVLHELVSAAIRGIDGATAAVDAQQTMIDELANERQRVADEPNPGPPPNPTRPDATRTELDGAPLYVCVDFADHVDGDARSGLEAALAAAGLLDARVTDSEAADDRLDAALLPYATPTPTSATLADILVPVPVDGLGADRIAAVLRSIPLVDDVVELHPNGRWRLGPVAGRYTQPSQQYIGHAAREQRRAERLAAIDAHLAHERATLERLDSRREQLLSVCATAEQLRGDQPSTASLAAALDELRRRANIVDERASTLADAQVVVAECLQAADHASAELHRAATRLRLPATEIELQEVGNRLRDCDHQVRAVRGDRAALERAVTTFEHAAESAARLADRAESDRSAAILDEAFAESELLRYTRLRDNVGADAQQAVQALAAARARRKEIDSEHGKLLAGVGKAETTIATLNERIGQLATKQTESAAALTDAERRFAVICSSEISDVLAVHGVESDAEPRGAARRILADTQPPPEDATNRMERAHREILLDGLRAGHDPSMPKVDGVDVVRVGTVDGNLPIGTLARQLRDEHERTGQLLTKQEREIFETHLLTRVGDALRHLLLEADAFEHRINAEMARVPTESGMIVELRWESDGDEPGLRDAIRALRTAPDLLGPEQRESLREFFMQRIADLRSAEPGRSFAETLTAALDYRAWHQFTLYARFTTGKRQRVTRRFYRDLSGGEAATLLHLPLFAAAGAQYSNATVDGPRLIALDEAFVGIDDKMRARLMGLLTQLDLDVLLTSHEFWGFYDTVPALVLYDLIRRPPTPGVYAQRFDWTADNTAPAP